MPARSNPLPATIGRFRVEALLGTGEIGGVVYIAMEFLKGEDLAAVLRRGELSFEAKIRVLIQVLEALEHAHANDVIHRDIKHSVPRSHVPEGSERHIRRETTYGDIRRQS